jgi:hypothetical protein
MIAQSFSCVSRVCQYGVSQSRGTKIVREKTRNTILITVLFLIIFLGLPEYSSGQQPMILASNLHNPTTLTVDQSYAYWVESFLVPPSVINVLVRRIPVSGGTPPDIATQNFGTNISTSLDVDNTSVYWSINPGSGSGILYKAPIAGGTPVALTQANQPTTIAADGTYLYWVETNGGGFTGVRKIPVNGGPNDVITLTSDNSFIYTGLAMDDAYVYFSYLATAQPFPFNTKYDIAKVPKGGGDVINLAQFVDGALASLVVDNSSVYWTASDTGTIQQVSINGGAVTTLASGLNQPMRVAVDATHVYWTENAGGIAGAGAVRSVPVAGGTVTTLASALNSPYAIVADGSSIYWTELGTNGTDGTIKKIGVAIPSVPHIISISPTSGPAGTLVTITGSNFGSTQSSSTITFGATPATVSSWSDTQIKAIVPSLSAGTYDVVVTTSAGISNSVVFTLGGSIATPHITSIAPTSGPVGTLITITGANFGIIQDFSTVKFDSTPIPQNNILSWNDTQIQITIPQLLAKNYSVVVATNAGTSNTVALNVIDCLLRVSDPSFDKAFPEIEKYLKKTFKITDASQDVLEAVTWGEVAGVPLWKILIFAITVDELIKQTNSPFENIHHEKILLELADFTAQWGFTSLLSSLGASFAGVAAWASLGALPITSALELVYRDVQNTAIQNQIKLYFLARNAGCSHQSIVNGLDNCAGATLSFTDDGWLNAVSTTSQGNLQCFARPCYPRPLTPDVLYEYAEMLWLHPFERIRSDYSSDTVEVENILKMRIDQCTK